MNSCFVFKDDVSTLSKISIGGGAIPPFFKFICCFQKPLLYLQTNETSMITKLLEATATIKDKNYQIMNTMMDISIEWDIELTKTETSALLTYKYLKVIGGFTWDEKKESYKRTVTITFQTDNTWKITKDVFQPTDNYQKQVKDVPSPVGAKINFDEKTIKIY